MPVKIQPSVLAFTTAAYRTRFQIARSLHRTIHFDVMDGKFVRTVSPGPASFKRWRLPPGQELHLMVRRPREWFTVIQQQKIQHVIVPVELGPVLSGIMTELRKLKANPVISINPRTPVSRLRPWIKQVRRLHVMTVAPGGYGAPFQPAMLKRINLLHRRYPRHTISCDGGMQETTIPQAARAGASIIIVGSRLITDPSPRRALRRLERLV